jgi:hypothetical protein
MKLSCNINPEHFDMLGDQKIVDFRQFEEIQFTNNVTGDIRTFHVENIELIPEFKHKTLKGRYPDIPWDPNLPIFGIILGTEIKPFVMAPSTAVQQNIDKVRATVGDNQKYEPWGGLAHGK